MRSTLLFLSLFILGNQLKANSAFELSKKLNINLKPAPPASGKIIDAKGNPIAGVNVTTKGRSVGTVTDGNGNFEIVAEVGEILYISHIGFKTVEVKATATPLSITLEEDATTLNTVSVLGSRGKPRTDVNRPVPIDIIMAEELQSTGQVELGVMIKYVAPSFNSNKYYNAVGSFTDPATLRGLWPDQVLAPARRTRSSPCQPSPTNAVPAGCRPQLSGNSSATGARSQAGAPRQASGSSATGIGTPGSRHSWILPRGVSMFSNTGADERTTTFSSAPAARRRSSSAALDPAPSTPTRTAVRSPSLASIRPPYVTPPPSRQPRSSSAARSRDAEPTTTTSGTARRDPVNVSVRCIVGRVVRPRNRATGRQRDGDLSRAFL